MTQYTRPDELVFASGAKPGELQSFPDIPRGWGVTFDQTTGVPPMEWFNALFKRSDEAVRYLLQRGIGEWSTTEDYPTGAHVQEGGKVWKAKAANVGKRPSINPTEWVETALTRDALKTLIQEQLGGGTLNFGQWLWSAATSGAPANGYLALNNSTPANATALLIAKSSNEGLDYSRGLSILRAGDTICFQSRDGGSVVQRFRVTGELVDSGTYRSVPVTHVGGAGGVPAANASLQVLLTPAGASDMGMPLMSVQWWVSRASIPAGCAPADGQLLSRALYPDVWAAIRDGKVPKTTEATWSSDPTQRGMFTEGDGSTTFRMPDYNGKAVGSLGALFLRGDGALSAGTAGKIQLDEIKAHNHSINGASGSNTTKLAYLNQNGGGGDFGGASTTFEKGGIETRPLNITGCWIIKMGSEVANPGAIDAAAISSTYAKLVTRVEALEGSGVPLMSVQWWVSRASIPAGCAPADGQLLSRALYPDVWAAIRDGKVPKTTEATWSSDPTQRGMFTEGDGSTTFRMPDYNGKATGSLGALFLRGDGALSAGSAGVIQRDAMQQITGYTGQYTKVSAGTAPSGAFSVAADTTTAHIGSSGSGSTGLNFDSALSPNARTAPETRSLNVTGCWVIQLAGSVTHAGSIDAQALASVYAALVSRVESLELRPRALGDGQAWQDVTASRALNTNFTNTTGRTIAIAVSTNGGPITSLGITVNGVQVMYGGYNSSTSAAPGSSLLIPPGAVYLVTSSTTFNKWMELR
ncbi:phage tail protein [Pseudomonas tohonis]|uniref:phage tail protein n=1 Tax=Pseudomonas tohonis TaxID=2725477 RepID=UPI00255B80DC|nr:phage tail protein [Pseudomonas tohonis]